MKQYALRLLGTVVVAGIIFIPSFSHAQYTIGTIERKPFVYSVQGELKGFSIELMKEIAERNDLEYTFQVEDTFASMLSNVETSTVDLAISNISITSQREKVMDFSHPIYDSGLQVLVGQTTTTLQSKKRQRIALWICALLMAYLILNRLKKYLNFVPSSGILMALWILGCGIVVVNVSAKRAAPEAIIEETTIPYLLLENNKIGVAVGTTMENFLIANAIEYKAYDDFTHSLHALHQGKVTAIVGDAAVSKYYANNAGASKVALAGGVFEPDKLGIAFPEDSALREQMNRSLLQIKEDGTYERLVEKYFGDENW